MKRKRATQQQQHQLKWHEGSEIEKRELPTLYNQFIRFLFFFFSLYINETEAFELKWEMSDRTTTGNNSSRSNYRVYVLYGKHKTFLSFRTLSLDCFRNDDRRSGREMVKQMGLSIQTVYGKMRNEIRLPVKISVLCFVLHSPSRDVAWSIPREILFEGIFNFNW